MKRVLFVALLILAAVLFGGCQRRDPSVERVSENITRYHTDGVVSEEGLVLFEKVSTVVDYRVGH